MFDCVQPSSLQPGKSGIFSTTIKISSSSSSSISTISSSSVSVSSISSSSSISTSSSTISITSKMRYHFVFLNPILEITPHLCVLDLALPLRSYYFIQKFIAVILDFSKVLKKDTELFFQISFDEYLKLGRKSQVQ